MLHTVNKSPFSSPVLQSCLELTGSGDAILFLNDGIYGALANSPCVEEITRLAADCRFYALEEDVRLRGMEAALLDCVQLIGYAEFVELSAEHAQCQSWY